MKCVTKENEMEEKNGQGGLLPLLYSQLDETEMEDEFNIVDRRDDARDDIEQFLTDMGYTDDEFANFSTEECIEIVIFRIYPWENPSIKQSIISHNWIEQGF